jgi:hypothetical protein
MFKELFKNELPDKTRVIIFHSICVEEVEEAVFRTCNHVEI